MPEADKQATADRQTTPAASDEPASPFAGREREALIQDIVNEIRRDSVKEGALARLKKADWPELISGFFRHPAVLVLVGFAVTGIIGARIANTWQQGEWNRQHEAEGREWERQQLRLVEIKEIDLKYGLVDEITKAVGARNAAALGVVEPLLSGGDEEQFTARVKEREKEWVKASSEWRALWQTLRLKLSARIKDAGALTIYDAIVNRQRGIAGKVSVVVKNPARYRRTSPDTKVPEIINEILNDIESNGEELKCLTDAVTYEARSDAGKAAP